MNIPSYLIKCFYQLKYNFTLTAQIDAKLKLSSELQIYSKPAKQIQNVCHRREGA